MHELMSQVEKRLLLQTHAVTDSVASEIQLFQDRDIVLTVIVQMPRQPFVK